MSAKSALHVHVHAASPSPLTPSNTLIHMYMYMGICTIYVPFIALGTISYENLCQELLVFIKNNIYFFPIQAFGMVHELSSCFGHFIVSVVHVCFLCICKGVCDYYRCIRQIFHNYWRREGRGWSLRREGR